MDRHLGTVGPRTDWRDWLAAGLLLAISAYLCGIYLLTVLPFSSDLVKDDVFYFLKIAKNIAAGNGITFDGLSPTNGYQPLWQFLLVPLFWIFGDSPDAMLRIAFVFQILLLAAAGLLFHSEVRRTFGSRIALIGGIVYASLVLVAAANGMESGVLIVSIVLLFAAGRQLRVFTEYHAGRSLLWGMLLALVFLARLDHVFLVMVVFGMQALEFLVDKPRRATIAKRIFWMGLGAGLLVSPYLLANYLATGSIIPISGALKSTFPQISLSAETLWRIGIRKFAIAALCFFYLLFTIMRVKSLRELPQPRRYFRLATAALAAGIVLHIAYTALFMYSGVFSWYFVAGTLLLALLVCELSDWILRKLPERFAPPAFGLAVLVLVALGLYNTADKTWALQPTGAHYPSGRYDAALWAKANTPPDAIFAQQNTGMFAWFSERNTVNLDGLVNNIEYQDALKAGRLRSYLAQKNVRYLVYTSVANVDKLQTDYTEEPVRFWSLMHHTFSEPLPMRREYEVYRSPTYLTEYISRAEGAKLPVVILVWDLRPLYSIADNILQLEISADGL